MKKSGRKNRQDRGVAGRRIVLIASGGISVYKSAYLSRIMKREGAEVRVVMTEAATRFVTPLTFKTLTGNPVAVSMFPRRDDHSVIHIDLASWAERIVVAPATADFMARIAAGMADDLASAVISAARCPVILAPAMNEGMWQNRATVRNVDILRGDGFAFIHPGTGELACGDQGTGRMAEPEEIAAAAAESFRSEGMLAGRKILVTAGRTEESIDSVRYITNRSSGRMGCAIARRAGEMGAEVTLVCGAVDVPVPAVEKKIEAVTASAMKEAVLDRFAGHDTLIMTAAVSDYKPSSPGEGKIRREADSIALELEKTDDILKMAGDRKGKSQRTVGFALECEEDDGAAMKKLKEKNCDLMVLNVIGARTGFSAPTNRITIYNREGKVLSTGLITKDEAAGVILNQLVEEGSGD
ncbi:MAG: bifunctional phosphopantothenoylcysteine decarboxylase/phosphopantothenate--cysteine ligase CoaBC [Candidatus Krumholzibacteriales bacterium]